MEEMCSSCFFFFFFQIYFAVFHEFQNVFCTHLDLQTWEAEVFRIHIFSVVIILTFITHFTNVGACVFGIGVGSVCK